MGRPTIPIEQKKSEMLVVMLGAELKKQVKKLAKKSKRSVSDYVRTLIDDAILLEDSKNNKQ